jgi:outer membrane protein TolC
MERMIEMAETMVLPPFTLNLSIYEDQAIATVGSQAPNPSFAVSTPASMGAGLPKMPWFGTNDAFLRQTRQKLAALRQEVINAEADSINQVRLRWFELDRAMREKRLYQKTVVNLSQAALDVSTRGYESGKVSFADTIASYANWLKSNLTLERKRSDVGIAWAELEKTVGTPLN